jgi:tetratricopeptide (TPR) repeat protein
MKRILDLKLSPVNRSILTAVVGAGLVVFENVRNCGCRFDQDPVGWIVSMVGFYLLVVGLFGLYFTFRLRRRIALAAAGKPPLVETRGWLTDDQEEFEFLFDHKPPRREATWRQLKIDLRSFQDGTLVFGSIGCVVAGMFWGQIGLALLGMAGLLFYAVIFRAGIQQKMNSELLIGNITDFGTRHSIFTDQFITNAQLTDGRVVVVEVKERLIKDFHQRYGSADVAVRYNPTAKYSSVMGARRPSSADRLATQGSVTDKSNDADSPGAIPSRPSGPTRYLPYALFALAAITLVGYRFYAFSRDDCNERVLTEDFSTTARVCHRARSAGWIFQGIDPERYAGVLNNLGLMEIRLQHDAAAKQALDESAQRLKKLAPQGLEMYAAVLSNLALLSQRDGDTAEEERLSRQSVALYGSLGLPCDRNAVTAASNLGRALRAGGKLEEAESVLQDRTERNEKCGNLSTYSRGATFRGLGEAELGLRKDEEALDALDKAVVLLRSTHEDDSLELGESLMDRADALANLHRYPEAEHDANLSLSMLTRQLGPDALEVANAHATVGAAIRRQKQYVRAMKDLNEAERIYRLRLGANHPWLASLLLQKGKALDALGQRDEALQDLKEAERIRIAVFGPASPQVQHVRDELETNQQSESVTGTVDSNAPSP